MAFRAITQLELLDDVIPETTVAEVCHADAASIYMVAEDIPEIVACKAVDDEQAFPFALRYFFLVGEFPFFDFYAVFLGKVFQCFGIGHLLMLHDEVHGISTFSARKTLAQPFGGRYIKGRGFIVMERTQAHIVDAALAQGDEVRYHIGDLCGVEYAVYGGLVYHCCFYVCAKVHDIS